MMIVDIILRLILVSISVGAAFSNLSVNTVMAFYQSLTAYYQVILPNYMVIKLHKKQKD
jgi:hypothetical protein